MPPLNLFLAYGFTSLLGFVLFLNVFGLPANWLILLFAVGWAFLFPGSFTLLYWFVMGGLALAGEMVEMAVQVKKARAYGCSSSGTFFGIIGAFAGAIFLAPLFWGAGAFIGALAGAWCGCLVMELIKGRNFQSALHSAFGAMLGRFLGTTCKIGFGAVMIVFTSHYVIPEQPDAIVPKTPEITAFLSNLPPSCLSF